MAETDEQGGTEHTEAEHTGTEHTDAEGTPIPEQVHENYANEQVRAALHALQQTPDYDHLAAFLTSLREGYLVVDVSGTPSKKRGHRVRTIRSTRGQLVLPLFTSMDELRAVTPAGQHDQFRGAVMPAKQALSLIGSDRFVAAEFDKAGQSLVVLRKYIMLVLGSDAAITAETLEMMK
ncbi:MAG: SseB family protein [Leucobacter sp.]